MNGIYRLGQDLEIDNRFKQKLVEDYDAIQYESATLTDYVLNRYGIDITGKYGSRVIRNPFGKASGQLSSKTAHVRADNEHGLGFSVLKTVISQDKQSHASMGDWKVGAPKMTVEEIVSANNEVGYTVTWAGKGYDKTFPEYLQLLQESYEVSGAMLVVPSVQFHVPLGTETFKESEYAFTAQAIENVWNHYAQDPFVLEHDFSATLSSLHPTKEDILRWVTEVPKLIDKYIKTKHKILGIKLFNSLYGVEFQKEILKTLIRESGDYIDVITCFNRLFDPDKVYQGKKGIAYGGYDLSDRNLAVLDDFQKEKYSFLNAPDISATGNINSGKMMAEYALRGATSGQIHTFFQVPSNQYHIKQGSRVTKALHELLFNPDNGLVATLIHIRNRLGISYHEVYRFLDVQRIEEHVCLQ